MSISATVGEGGGCVAELTIKRVEFALTADIGLATNIIVVKGDDSNAGRNRNRSTTKRDNGWERSRARSRELDRGSERDRLAAVCYGDGQGGSAQGSGDTGGCWQRPQLSGLGQILDLSSTAGPVSLGLHGRSADEGERIGKFSIVVRAGGGSCRARGLSGIKLFSEESIDIELGSAGGRKTLPWMATGDAITEQAAKMNRENVLVNMASLNLKPPRATSYIPSRRGPTAISSDERKLQAHHMQEEYTLSPLKFTYNSDKLGVGISIAFSSLSNALLSTTIDPPRGSAF